MHSVRLSLTREVCCKCAKKSLLVRRFHELSSHIQIRCVNGILPLLRYISDSGREQTASAVRQTRGDWEQRAISCFYKATLWTSLKSTQCWVERLICGLGICPNPIFLVVILSSPIRQMKTCTFFSQFKTRQCDLQWNKIMKAHAWLRHWIPMYKSVTCELWELW